MGTVRDCYGEVKALAPDLYRRVVNIGNIVTCAPYREVPLDLDLRVALGAKVEMAAMELLADALLSEREKGRAE